MRLPTILAVLAGSTVANGAIAILDFSPGTNDRFADDPSFVAAGLDWSGVGRASNGTWVTMISDSVFLSSNHFHPANGATLTFHPGNTPGDDVVTATVGGGQRIGGTDLWIGFLEGPLPMWIASYGLADVALTSGNFTSTGLSGAEVLMSGISPTTSGYGASVLTNQAVGTNHIERFMSGVSSGGSTGDTIWTVRNEPGDLNYVMTTHEAQLASGDSGSPLFMLMEGEMVLTGIAWAIGSVNVLLLAQREATVYTYVGNYVGEINAYMGDQAIPEPGLALMFGMGVIFLAARQRGR